MIQVGENIAGVLVAVDPGKIELSSLELNASSYETGPNETTFDLTLGGSPLSVGDSGPTYATKKEAMAAYKQVSKALKAGNYKLELYNLEPRIRIL